ncbi:sulfite exporter TauE/SafE family protein [Nonomuraea dietziae]|uniref:sulfite exporter TauE/SafE family protein n=1 Tax=Nonomuraea dietziae TaxID=65515 RepID=UPI00343F4FDC
MEPVALFVSGTAAGLVAGTASCTAVQGGLLFGLQGTPRVVARFLAGRLASYVTAGAVLGALGSMVRLPPPVRAGMLVAAGFMVIFFALRMLRHRRCEPRPPARRLKAPLLGAATVLLPCGVTLSMEMLAVTSASAVGGAAVMGGFVVGTAPAFALLGFVLRRVSQSRLAAFAGIVAVAAGLWTITSGLSLGGWLPQEASRAAAMAKTGPGGVQLLTIWATERGYRPGVSQARAGVPVEVDFRAGEGAACATHLTIDGRDVDLPATVRLPAQPPGQLRYVCAMGMFTGFITFR